MPNQNIETETENENPGNQDLNREANRQGPEFENEPREEHIDDIDEGSDGELQADDADLAGGEEQIGNVDDESIERTAQEDVANERQAGQRDQQTDDIEIERTDNQPDDVEEE